MDDCCGYLQIRGSIYLDHNLLIIFSKITCFCLHTSLQITGLVLGLCSHLMVLCFCFYFVLLTVTGFGSVCGDLLLENCFPWHE